MLRSCRSQANTSSGTTCAVATSLTVTGISVAASAVVTVNSAATKNPFQVGDALYFSGVVGMTQINGLTGLVTAIGGSSGAWTGTFNINSTGFSPYSSGGTVGLNIQLGDIIIFAANGGGGGTSTITFPAGFSSIPNCPNLNVQTTAAVALKVATSTEVSATTLSYTSSSNDFQVGHVRVYSGRNQASPVTASQSTGPVAAASAPISVSETGLTAAAGDDLVNLIMMNASNTGVTISSSGFSGFGNEGFITPAASFDPNIAYMDYVNNPGGAIGTLAGTLTFSDGGPSISYGAYLISLAQAPTAAALAGAPSDTTSASGTLTSPWQLWVSQPIGPGMNLTDGQAGGFTGPTVIAVCGPEAPYGSLAQIFPLSAGTSGTLVVNDCAKLADATVGNQIFSLDYSQISSHQPVNVNAAFRTGLCISSVPAGMRFAVLYDGPGGPGSIVNVHAEA